VPSDFRLPGTRTDTISVEKPNPSLVVESKAFPIEELSDFIENHFLIEVGDAKNIFRFMNL